MGTRTRYSLILLLLFTLTGWAQNIRVTSITAGAGGITNNGPFKMTNGAGNLRILTSDANGVGSWQAAGSAVDTNALARLNGLGTNAQINGFTVTAGGFTNLATYNTNAGPVYNGSYVTTYGVNTNKGNSFFEGNMRFANGDYEYDSVGRTHGFNGSILSDDIITIVSGGLSIAGGPLVVNDPSTMNDLTIGVTGTLTASGPTRLLGSLALAPTTNTSLAINQAGAAHQRYTTNANFAVTFTGTALDGARGQFDVVNTAATNITVTWPVSYSVASGATFTSFTAKSNAITEVFWHKVSGSNIANVATKEIVENFLNPTAGQAVVFHDANTKTNATLAGSGDVSSAANIGDNAVVRGDGGAKGVQTSGMILDDLGNALLRSLYTTNFGRFNDITNAGHLRQNSWVEVNAAQTNKQFTAIEDSLKVDDRTTTGDFTMLNGAAANTVMRGDGSGIGSWGTVSSVLDVIGSTRGSILYRGAAGWAILAPGTSGHVLTSQGAGADPIYATSGAGATDWHLIGDAASSATIGFGTTEQTISSALNGGAILTLTNTVADNTSDTIGLRVTFNDSADANSIFARFVDDGDGSPVARYTFAADIMTVNAAAAMTSLTLSSTAQFDGASTFTASLQMPQSGADGALSNPGEIRINTADEQVAFHSGADGEISGEAVLPLIQTKAWTFDPKAVCDGAVDRLFLMWIQDEAPEGIIIDEWKISFEADPTTEIDADLKYADAMIGVANAVTVDALDTTAGTATEDTDANINGGAAIPTGKVLYLEFATAYTEANHQMMFQIWFHYEED